MFWLKKIISQLFLPIPLTVLFILLTLLLMTFAASKLKSLATLSLLAAVMLLVGLSQSDSSYYLANSLESQYPINSAPIPPSQQCVVMVLGSGHSDKAGLTAVHKLSAVALGRLTEGMRQLAMGQNCQLVVSGWNGGYMSTAHATIMKQAAIELGVKPDTIISFPEAKDTIEEAMFLYRVVGQQPFRLVTSATHMPRSMMIFSALGMQPQAAPGDFIAEKGLWWRLDASNLLTSQKSIHEYVGMLWLSIRGVSADQMVNQLSLDKELD
ncbi:YdcF family protein [Shewanella sp. OMA3-2]|uniref:YdcF family protein n=1 Tax=Shewanella sp. OMA3-2 TaxID=2908650 RepID=UPI001F39626B|nr:YdcF family protein [Shewanella sp. OMA3-2]UJF20443.1 YdcF family protein [Shewanella sp. OMA3-2]